MEVTSLCGILSSLKIGSVGGEAIERLEGGNSRQQTGDIRKRDTGKGSAVFVGIDNFAYNPV